MKISIWQQFSSNHSNNFTVVGEFATEEDAAHAAIKLREIFRQILQSDKNRIVGYDKKRKKFDYDKPTRIERKYAKTFDMKWDRHLDWIWGHPTGHVVMLNKTLIISPIFLGDTTWLGADITDDLVAKLGGQVQKIAEFDGGLTWYITVKAHAPDQQVIHELYGQVRAYIDQTLHREYGRRERISSLGWTRPTAPWKYHFTFTPGISRGKLIEVNRRKEALWSKRLKIWQLTDDGADANDPRILALRQEMEEIEALNKAFEASTEAQFAGWFELRERDTEANELKYGENGLKLAIVKDEQYGDTLVIKDLSFSEPVYGLPAVVNWLREAGCQVEFSIERRMWWEGKEMSFRTWDYYSLGADLHKDGRVYFLVWGLYAQEMSVHLLRENRVVPLTRNEWGYFYGFVEDVQPGDTYFYVIDNVRERPDPASRYQPEGVHGPSQIVDSHFEWTDKAFTPPTLRDTVFYELHVGTMTPEGTFLSLISHLPRLRELGITTIELMPVAQCPGGRNWGYDGVGLYAPMSAYGTPDDLKTLVNAAHNHGLAVFLDVVYNHLGPEGNYLWDYGPYFTDRYRGAWGDSVNFDGHGSDEVRRFFIENAIYWLDEYHIDGLRLDATHALLDFTAVPFLEHLTAAVHDWAEGANRRVYLVAENDSSDRKIVLPQAVGGRGLDGQWLDDFNHTVHTTLTGEVAGYFANYGDFSMMTKVLRDRFALTGEYSRVHGRRHGTPAGDIPADRFIVSVQNHDQVGNRRLGDRLYGRSGFEAAKLAAGYLLTSPYTPMLFMGEEYGEDAPFLFFTEFGDENLIAAVRKGRKEEFAYFADQGEPPDPHDIETFNRSKLNHDLRHEGEHAILYKLYETLLALRRDTPALTNPDPAATVVYDEAWSRIFCVERTAEESAVRMVFNWRLDRPQTFTLPGSAGQWRKILDSCGAEWRLDGVSAATAPESLDESAFALTLPPSSFVVYAMAENLHP